MLILEQISAMMESRARAMRSVQIVTFNSFYDRCQRFLAAQMSMAQMAAYDLLYGTCTRALPSEPLLRAAIVCAADPCEGLDCGEHGSCDVGSCRCDHGYSGRHCKTADPCQVPTPVTCGSHGSCSGGKCFCEQRYNGTLALRDSLETMLLFTFV